MNCPFLVAPIQHIGCSDEEYETDSSEQGDVSEFSSTPNTSVESTPDPTPVKPVKKGENQTISRGKDLTLLMELGKNYETPAESLYFREMARSKTTPKVNPRKSSLAGKTPRTPIPTKAPRKNLKKSVKSTTRSKGTPQTGGVKRPM